MHRSGLTKTEVAIVLAITASLTLFATLAALPPRDYNGKVPRIVLEIKEMERALREFKADFDTLPPNCTPNVRDDQPAVNLKQDLIKTFKKMFPRHQEPESLILAMVGEGSSALEGGMTPSESLVFWLRGFSKDENYPLSGKNGPSFSDAEGNNDGTLDACDEQFPSGRMYFEFDPNRLEPWTSAPGDSDAPLRKRHFDDRESKEGTGRYLEYNDPRDGTRRRINFWRYHPRSSTLPFVYFDTSRYTPSDYYPQAQARGVSEPAPLLKRHEAPESDPSLSAGFVYVQQGNLQILHAGLDDAWGDFSDIRNGTVLFPTGPFEGDLADTLTNFTVGSLEHESDW